MGLNRYDAYGVMMSLEGHEPKPSEKGAWVRYEDVFSTTPDLAEVGRLTSELRKLAWSFGGETADLIDALIALATAQAAQIAGLTKELKEETALAEDMVDQVANLVPAVNREAVEQRARAEAAEAKVTELAKKLDDEKKMRRSGVKAAFDEGFVRGADDGWLNNPRMEREWRRSSAKMGLKT